MRAPFVCRAGPRATYVDPSVLPDAAPFIAPARRVLFHHKVARNVVVSDAEPFCSRPRLCVCCMFYIYRSPLLESLHCDWQSSSRRVNEEYSGPLVQHQSDFDGWGLGATLWGPL